MAGGGGGWELKKVEMMAHVCLLCSTHDTLLVSGFPSLLTRSPAWLPMVWCLLRLCLLVYCLHGGIDDGACRAGV